MQGAFPLLYGQQTVCAKMFPYVFHIHNGIINQRADGNGHTAKTHGIYRQAHKVEYQNGCKQGNGDGYDGNEGGTDIGKEQNQNDSHKETAFDERALHVADSTFNETRLTEYVSGNLYIRRQMLLYVF